MKLSSFANHSETQAWLNEYRKRHGKRYSVYALADPSDRKIYYVGLSPNPKARWHQHRSHSKSPKRDICTGPWIRKLTRSGLKPKLIILETRHLLKNDALDMERQWIRYLYAKGEPLLNKYMSIGKSWKPHSLILEPKRIRLNSPFGY